MYAACLLQILVRPMLKDAATLSWPGLVKQVLPNRDSCWLASANGEVMSSSPGEGRTVLHTIVLPSIRSSSGAPRGSPCSGAARGAHSKRSSSLAAHCSSSSNKVAAEQPERGEAGSSSNHSSGQRATDSNTVKFLKKLNCLYTVRQGHDLT